jgi:acetyltransferase-like isoleucine patch superfamily enzyme
MLFDGLTHSRLLPVPLMRLVYRVLGARMGSNSYSAGLILDPIFVTIGANSIIGDAALLVPHVIEGGKLGHFPIVIGDNVTIGAHAIILPGVVIGDDVIIAAHSMVAKGARIRSGELWAGVPARRLR